jgi:hypothetical protein
MSNAEINFTMDALEVTADKFRAWGKDYTYNPGLNEFSYKGVKSVEETNMEYWFNPANWTKHPRMRLKPI